MSELLNLSAIDGRYHRYTAALRPYLSEAALIDFRIRVEAAWLLHLGGFVREIKGLFTDSVSKTLTQLSRGASSAQIATVKEIEKTTNHDVKAVEYFLRQELSAQGAPSELLAWIHFACTSEDINNVAYAMMLREARDMVLLVHMNTLETTMKEMAARYASTAMLSRTHGQTASPTTLGKELAVFAHRLGRQRRQLASLEFWAKMNGAVGNYSAHHAALPELDWPGISQKFLLDLGLEQNPLTTQIENHDNMIEFVDALRRYHVILIGFCRDMWGYISLGYFRQQLIGSEVGSSTMPHKVNPIDFENAEGNLGVAVALAQHFAEKLPISRWQRDLSDSTVLRALGTMAGHGLVALRSLEKGLAKVEANQDKIAADLDQAWEVLAEPLQSIMRAHGVKDAYERLKEETRGKPVTRDVLHKLARECRELSDGARQRFLELSPRDYLGIAPKLVEDFVSQANKN